MGDGVIDEGSAAPAGGSTDIDVDAPWRPGYDGWADIAAAPTDHDATDARRDVDEADERWSREHDLAEPEPWVPQRPPRKVRAAAPEPVGRPVADVVGQPSSSVLGSVVLGATAIVAAVVAASLVAFLLWPSGAESSTGTVSAPIIPETATPLWSIELEGLIDATAVGEESVVVHSQDSGVLMSLDRTTGAELWRVPTVDSERGVDSIAVIDDVVVVVQWRGTTGTTHVTAFDASSGDRRWSSAPSDALTTVANTPQGDLVIRRERVDDRSVMFVLDPRSGEPIAGPIAIGAVDVPGAFVGAAPTDGQAEAWSLQTLAPATPPIDSFNVRSIAPMGDLTVGLDLEGRILAFDEDGVRTDEQRFTSDAFGEFTSRAGLVGVVEDAGVGLISSGSSMGFEIVDGRIAPVWQRLGRVFAPVDTEIGAVGLLLGPTGDSGEINESIIDPVTGETIAVTDDGVTREQSPLLGHNGYVVMPEIGNPQRTLSARDYRGGRLWELEISGNTRYEVQAGLVLLVERSLDMSTVSALG